MATKEPKTYFIVEFRFPFEIKTAKDAKAAADKAQEHFSEQYGFIPDLWNARIFEFTFAEGSFGPQNEYFFSPTGMTMKEISKNILPHLEMIEKSEDDRE